MPPVGIRALDCPAQFAFNAVAMSKSGKDPVKLFDTRLIERNVTRGLINRKDIQRHLDALPDVSGKAMTLAQAEADRIARMPPPPPPMPVVTATAPARSYSDLDYDEPFDDDDEDEDLDEPVATAGAEKPSPDLGPDDGDDEGDDDLADDDDGEPPAPLG